MSMRERIATAAALALLASCAAQRAAPPAKGPALGQAVDAAEVARYDISIPPSGAGLPKGNGTARAGAAVYEQKCQACHGAKGAGKPADALAGGIGSLGTKTPMRTVGSYWPYATTLFDYVRRAMPITNPLSLSDEETYAVTAYVLYLNGIIGEDLAMDAQSLPQVKMPNRDGFISDWPPREK
jgi:S-disulfanyl-L-cysteine oxidoreductase SoxD